MTDQELEAAAEKHAVEKVNESNTDDESVMEVYRTIAKSDFKAGAVWAMARGELPLDQEAREIIIKHALWDAGFCGEQSAERGPVMLKVFELVEAARHERAEEIARLREALRGHGRDIGRDASE